MTAWWTSKATSVETRILIALEISDSAWMSTDDIVDHWLLYAYDCEEHIRRALGNMKRRGWVVSRPIEERGVHQWRMVVEGVGIRTKTTEQ